MNVEQLTSIEMWLFSPLYILIYLALWRLRCRPAAAGRDGAEKGYTIPAGRWGIWLVILPPILLIVMAIAGSADEYLWTGGSAILSGFALYPVALWWKKRQARVGEARVS
jgi:hypothetical protein